ncbi:hypothetical protein IKG45_03725 [Candidatus Saccharibacteria bacterium]|nr:hypothetical protein [Candidatus Saccharibacteria bacterium]
MKKRVSTKKEDKNGGKTKKTSLKTKTQRTRARLLGSYYGNPIRDMKLVCITGSTGKSITAHFVHEILKSSGEHVAILASEKPFKLKTLHKFFADAWKAGANYVVVTAPPESLNKNVFYNLPVEVAALTNYLDSSLTTPTSEEFLKSGSTLFEMNPKIVVLNTDDLYYKDFSKYSGKEKTLTYGRNYYSTLRIENSKLYRKGVEATFSLGSSFYTVASFLTGEPIISYMACAAAIATALGIDNQSIADGIANYEQEEAKL